MNSEFYSVGEFSKVTGLSIKTLRFYHEKGILVPTRVDESSGYRYYNEQAVERARIIIWLREMDFSIEDIQEILKTATDDADLLNRLEHQKLEIAQRMRREREIIRAIDRVLQSERQARASLLESHFRVEEKQVPGFLAAGIRFRGKYSDVGKAFGQLGRKAGRYISGKPFCLYYDAEYKDDDADIEACFPVRDQFSAENISVRKLPDARCLTLVHQGPYPHLGRSYQKLLKTAEQRGFSLSVPSREIYLKGPGMIFKGNPANYLTEIQLVIS